MIKLIVKYCNIKQNISFTKNRAWFFFIIFLKIIYIKCVYLGVFLLKYDMIKVRIETLIK